MFIVGFLVLYVFILGLCVGSFINALEYRLSSKKTIKGRSMCPNCKHQLVWYDLIPLISWVALRGKCRYCKKPISWQYPIVEFATGLAFVAAANYLNLFGKFNDFFRYYSADPGLLWSVILFVLLGAILGCFVLIALHDAKTTYVLQKPVYVALVLIIIYDLVSIYFRTGNQLQTLIGLAISGAVAYLFFYSFYFFSKGRWMGEGDAQIAGLVGLLAGPAGTAIALYFAFIVGSVFGLALVARKKAELKSQMAFGPFIVLGLIIAIAFGNIIAAFYARIFM